MHGRMSKGANAHPHACTHGQGGGKVAMYYAGDEPDFVPYAVKKVGMSAYVMHMDRDLRSQDDVKNDEQPDT